MKTQFIASVSRRVVHSRTVRRYLADVGLFALDMAVDQIAVKLRRVTPSVQPPLTRDSG